MASFNKVILMGNLTRDPEVRTTPGGMTIAKLGLAVSRVFNDRDGNKREETSFIDIDCFGKQAEVIAKYFGKGKPILVEGRLRQDSWENQQGEKRNKLVVVMENFQFVGSRDDSGGGGGGYGGGDYEQSSPPRRSNAPASSSSSSGGGIDDDDVPF